MKQGKVLAFISFIYALMLLYCWNKSLPYVYFQFIRVIGMIVFSLLSHHKFKDNDTAFAIFFLISVLIINPFIKVPLGRFYWNIIDTIWAVILLFNSITLFKESKNE